MKMSQKSKSSGSSCGMRSGGMPKKKAGGGMMGYAKGGSVTCRGNGMARGKKTKMY